MIVNTLSRDIMLYIREGSIMSRIMMLYTIEESIASRITMLSQKEEASCRVSECFLDLS